MIKNNSACKNYVNQHKDDQMLMQTTHAQFYYCKVLYKVFYNEVDRTSYLRTTEVIKHNKYERVYCNHISITTNNIKNCKRWASNKQDNNNKSNRKISYHIEKVNWSKSTLSVKGNMCQLTTWNNLQTHISNTRNFTRKS